jgi:dTDP-4-dehydrorhamnose reductase
MKVLVTGATGLVGSRYLELAPKDLEILHPDETELNITNSNSIQTYFNKEKPNSIIHFAAFTDPKKAELERGDKNGLAWKVNVEGTETLVEQANRNSIFFIHISTDLIFPGTPTKDEYYDEESIPEENLEKISWYGYTKLQAENIVKRKSNNFAIVRIAYPYRAKYEQKIDFARLFLQMYDTDTMYPLFTDNTICPTFIDDACLALNTVLNKQKPGIFHLTSNNPVSHYEFAKYIFEKTERDPSKIKPTLMSEFIKTSKVPRALFSTLKNDKTQKVLGIKLKTWQEGANTFLEQLRSI